VSSRFDNPEQVFSYMCDGTIPMVPDYGHVELGPVEGKFDEITEAFGKDLIGSSPTTIGVGLVAGGTQVAGLVKASNIEIANILASNQEWFEKPVEIGLGTWVCAQVVTRSIDHVIRNLKRVSTAIGLRSEVSAETFSKLPGINLAINADKSSLSNGEDDVDVIRDHLKRGGVSSLISTAGYAVAANAMELDDPERNKLYNGVALDGALFTGGTALLATEGTRIINSISPAAASPMEYMLHNPTPAVFAFIGSVAVVKSSMKLYNKLRPEVEQIDQPAEIEVEAKPSWVDRLNPLPDRPWLSRA
jgi:hypothetical protein